MKPYSSIPYMNPGKSILLLLFFLAAVCLPRNTQGQELLQKKITVKAKNKPVAEVLKMVEKQGGFYFSYNNNIIREDSLVTVSVTDKTVEQLLVAIFDRKYQFLERNNHLIIQPGASAQYWYVSGTVVDKITGEPIGYATVYERNQLVSTMTNEKGYFRLQLREGKTQSSISVSKVSYADTSVDISAAETDNVTLGMEQISYALDSVVISGVERTFLAGLFLSSKQTMNSLNLDGFFSKQPFQFSLTPGLGSHGRMGAQVVNKFSLNVLGGYTAGVKGVEIGTLFNIVKQDMQYLQLAGLFNIVGGNVKGVQVGGLHNHVLDTMTGVQLGGISNIVTEHVAGVQVGGIYNQSRYSNGIQVGGIGNITFEKGNGIQVGGIFNSTENFQGIQLAGVGNVNRQQTGGIQVAGLANFSRKEMKGLQIAGLANVTRYLRGVQIGIVNYADSSDGYSIGLINIIPKGYHKLSVSTSELQHLTMSYKSGNAKLYSILVAGTQLDKKQKAYSIGYGLGSDRSIGKGFYLNPELTHQYFYTGNEASQNLLTRLQFNLKYRLGKSCAIYAGPGFSVLYYRPGAAVDGYKSDWVNGFPSVEFSKQVLGWIGYNIGLDLF